MRVAVGFEGVRPLIQSIIACDCGSTGALETSRFHQLSGGKTCREERSSSRMTESPTANARGSLDPAEGGAVGARREAHAENVTSAQATQAARTKDWKRMARAPAAGCEWTPHGG